MFHSLLDALTMSLRLLTGCLMLVDRSVSREVEKKRVLHATAGLTVNSKRATSELYPKYFLTLISQIFLNHPYGGLIFLARKYFGPTWVVSA